MDNLMYISIDRWRWTENTTNCLWNCVKSYEKDRFTLIPPVGNFVRDFVRDHIEINWEAFNG